jgi:hypothetical protein
MGFQGSTSVLHDSELPTDVGHCEEPGCYSKAINYNSSIRQMAALAEISDECHQSIKVIQCLYYRWTFLVLLFNSLRFN